MPRDRFAELKQVNQTTDNVAPAHEEIEMGESGDTLGAFFADCDKIKANIAEIETNIKAISEKHGQALAAISEKQGQKNNEELDELMDNVRRKANQVRNSLKKMDADIQQMTPEEAGSANGRMKKQQQAALSRKFVEVMTEYNDVQSKYQQKYRERVKRQFKIVKPDATEEEVDAILDNEKGDSIFAQQILSPGHAEAKQALEDIQDRHKDIIKLEKSIRELHELFQDMATLVMQQGEMIDRIEFNVMQSTDYVESAAVQLKSAQKYQSSARKKKIAFFIVVGVILAIIAIVLGITLGTK